MKRLTPVFGRSALCMFLLTAAGCTGSPVDALNSLISLNGDQAALDQSGQSTAPGALPSEPLVAESGTDLLQGPEEVDDDPLRPGNSEAAVAAEAMGGAGDKIAMLPLPPLAPRPRKPEMAAPVCGSLAPGARGMGTVESNGVQFTVECFRAKSAKPGPAVLILHGARGIGRNTIYERLAEQLVERGQSAFIFQYLTAQDTQVAAAPANAKAAAKIAPAAGKTPAVVRPGATPQATKAAASRLKTPARKRPIVDTEAQTRAIDRAITAVQALSYVDHERIGMFGLSLGGFHALAIASRDLRVGAVVDMFGAMPRPVAPQVDRMPPTLVLHGDRDAVVPVRRALELQKLLKSIGAVHDVKIYKGQGHSFTGAADLDSVQRSVEFLVRYLGEPTARDG